MNTTDTPLTARALALSCLGFLVVLFVARLTGIPPHPPAERGPYIATAVALGAAVSVELALGIALRWPSVHELLKLWSKPK